MLNSNCAEQISESIPELGPDVKERILDAVTVALTDASEPNNEVAVGLSPSLDEQGVRVPKDSLSSDISEVVKLSTEFSIKRSILSLSM